MWTPAAGNLVRGFASLLAIEVLQRWLPGTNAGSAAAAAGVPAREHRAAPWASQPRSTDPQATLGLAACPVAFTVAAAVLLQRRDIT